MCIVHSGPEIYHVFAKYLFKAKAINTYFATLNFLCQRLKKVKWFGMFKPKTFKVDPLMLNFHCVLAVFLALNNTPPPLLTYDIAPGGS